MKNNFESKMKRLEEIVSKMNDDGANIELDEMVSLYEEAHKIIKELETNLSEAKDKINNLNK